jgi:hypothetical protein
MLSNAPRVLDYLVGGWSASGQLTLVSGFPLALASTGNSGVFSGRLRPNTTGKSAELTGPIQQRLNRYFDTSQFSIPAAFTFGNLGRTLNVRGPGLAGYDIALSKRFVVRESWPSLLFRAEAFNLTNTPFWGRQHAVRQSRPDAGQPGLRGDFGGAQRTAISVLFKGTVVGRWFRFSEALRFTM